MLAIPRELLAQWAVFFKSNFNNQGLNLISTQIYECKILIKYVFQCNNNTHYIILNLSSRFQKITAEPIVEITYDYKHKNWCKYYWSQVCMN